jgi:hypothetical protein
VRRHRFAQACSRKRARSYLLGLLSRSERKNGWTIAELAGDATPDGMQRLVAPASLAATVFYQSGCGVRGRWSLGTSRCTRVVADSCFAEWLDPGQRRDRLGAVHVGAQRQLDVPGGYHVDMARLGHRKTSHVTFLV